MPMPTPPSNVPGPVVVTLGDQAVLARCADPAAAVALAAAVTAAAPPWLCDVVPAYATVGVHFDADRISTTGVADWLARVDVPAGVNNVGMSHVIPVCYELGPDLDAVAADLGLTPAAVVALHTSAEYRVYAVGFVPGFAYLGYLPPALRGVPRLATPRVRVEPGSVGLTGDQTGVYPLARPGGWPLIGRTPLTLVDVAAGYFPLRVGDRVTFMRIAADEFDGRRARLD